MSAAKPKAAPLDRCRALRALARAARDYSAHDALPRELAARLIDSLDYYQGQPERVLDVGCGVGRDGRALRKRWPRASVMALDLSPAMLRETRRHAGWRRPLLPVRADALALPYADRSIDIVFSNLCLPWCGAPKPFLKELNRVLKPGGFMVASTLGPDTLKELRGAWISADPGGSHVDGFIDMHDIGDAALAAGLKDPVLDTDHLALDYATPRDLLLDLRGAGVINADPACARGLTGKARFRAMLDAYPRRSDGRIQASFEVVTLHAWGAPTDFLPRYGGRETPFEVVQWAERAPRPHRQR
ncbi:MAG TPA: methyltransferase domain-containing protein [Rhodanobacteraceae bacterium]|nr:methyltransferase domain-containing protein [Rhodanobacteraceae bacterium]